MNTRARFVTGSLSLVLVQVLGTAGAHAQESHVLSVSDRGDHVEIVARGATVAAGAKAEARGIWIEVTLSGPPKSDARISLPNDRTIKRAEVTLGGEKPRLG